MSLCLTGQALRLVSDTELCTFSFSGGEGGAGVEAEFPMATDFTRIEWVAGVKIEVDVKNE